MSAMPIIREQMDLLFQRGSVGIRERLRQNVDIEQVRDLERRILEHYGMDTQSARQLAESRRF